MNNKTRYNIYFFKRFELSKSKNHMYLRINDNTFDCYFCDFCGQYLYNETIICSCNIIEKIFKTYANFIEEIPEDFSGDELEDYIETPKNVNKDLMKYIYKMVLFSIIYKKDYYNKLNNTNVIITIIDYTI